MAWNVSNIAKKCGFVGVSILYDSRYGFIIPVDSIENFTDELKEWCGQNRVVFQLLEYYNHGGGWNLNFCSPDDLQIILDAEWLDNDSPEKVRARKFIETGGWSDVIQNHEEGKRPTRSQRGIVYILQSDNGLYKIGRAGDFGARLLQLSTLLPYDLELVMLISTNDYAKMELELHELFDHRRKKGEWFALDADDLKQMKEYALAKTL